MGKFTQAVEETAKFDGEEIKYTMRRMQNKHMLRLSPGFSTQAGDANIVLRTARLVEESKEVLKECISNVSGYKDAAGAAVPFEVMLEESYFLPLLDAMLGRLWQISVMTEVDAKKSAAIPPASSSGENPATNALLESLPDGGTTPSPVAST